MRIPEKECNEIAVVLKPKHRTPGARYNVDFFEHVLQNFEAF